MCIGIDSENDDFIFHRIKLVNSYQKKILCVIIDYELKFDPHIGECVKKQRNN